MDTGEQTEDGRWGVVLWDVCVLEMDIGEQTEKMGGAGWWGGGLALG
jgi:hypothetical protein